MHAGIPGGWVHDRGGHGPAFGIDDPEADVRVAAGPPAGDREAAPVRRPVKFFDAATLVVDERFDPAGARPVGGHQVPSPLPLDDGPKLDPPTVGRPPRPEVRASPYLTVRARDGLPLGRQPDLSVSRGIQSGEEEPDPGLDPLDGIPWHIGGACPDCDLGAVRRPRQRGTATGVQGDGPNQATIRGHEVDTRRQEWAADVADRGDVAHVGRPGRHEVAELDSIRLAARDQGLTAAIAFRDGEVAIAYEDDPTGAGWC